MAKQPQIGWRIEHYLPHIKERRQGVVIYLLGSQFCYQTDTGSTWLCMFNEDWVRVDALLPLVPVVAGRPGPHIPFQVKGDKMRLYRIDVSPKPNSLVKGKTLWVGTQEEARKLESQYASEASTSVNPVEIPYKKADMIAFLNQLYAGGTENE